MILHDEYSYRNLAILSLIRYLKKFSIAAKCTPKYTCSDIYQGSSEWSIYEPLEDLLLNLILWLLYLICACHFFSFLFFSFRANISDLTSFFLPFFVWVVIVQVKREELLQFARGAITGLKLNADIERWLLHEELPFFNPLFSIFLFCSLLFIAFRF